MLVCVTTKSQTNKEDGKERIHKTKTASKHPKTGLFTISYKAFFSTLQGAVLPSKKSDVTRTCSTLTYLAALQMITSTGHSRPLTKEDTEKKKEEEKVLKVLQHGRMCQGTWTSWLLFLPSTKTEKHRRAARLRKK